MEDFSLDDLNKYTRFFTTVAGEGGYGTVYVGGIPIVGSKEEKQIAVKVSTNHTQWEKEWRFLSTFQHENIIKLLGYGEIPTGFFLVLEYHTPLEAKFQVLEWPATMQIIKGAAAALNYMHTRRPSILHCDFKLDNIVIHKDDNTPMLIDFGTVSMERQQLGVTSASYRAPELKLSMSPSETTTKLDMFSFGVFILQMVMKRETKKLGKSGEYGHICQTARQELKDKKNIVVHRLLRRSGCKIEDVQQLMKIGMDCCELKPEKRPSMQEVIQSLEGIKIQKKK